MTEPRLDYVTCASPAGLHRMAYWEWGDPQNDKVLLCLHGLTRTGRDFDNLAARLSSHYRVVCPDVAGRGRSDWLADPASYVVPQYASDMLVLIARLRARQLDCLGTSMGGLILMVLAGWVAAAKARSGSGECGLAPGQSLSLGKIVLNDIGPALNFEGLKRIGEYVAQVAQFDTFAEAVHYVHLVSDTFGPHTQAQWEQLTRHVFVEQNGRWTKHYDLAMAQPFAAQSAAAIEAAEALLWRAYESIATPILVVRGELSDLLPADVARQMLARNSHARLFEVPGVGHAPTFLNDDQIDPVERFLLNE